MTPSAQIPQVEKHPLSPFLPPAARLLMLGSFPPPRYRWSMDFYYPNWNNDMWRIVGSVFFQDKDYFADVSQKRFRREQLVEFLQRTGIALYDTASAVRRLQANASDKYLEVVRPTDVPALLRSLPLCRALVTTGEKATDTLCQTFGIEAPGVGDFVEFLWEGHVLRLYRMPSSSRAYPLSLEKKAAAYRRMFQEIFG